MNTKLLFAVGIVMALACGCNEDRHFVSDSTLRRTIERDFENRRSDFAQGDFFHVFDTLKESPEREAMAFLYAYMPLGDITDYPAGFYLRNVQAAFEARKAMPWGDSIPEDLFRHFVLPIRVNNENMDESRMVFYDELKPRIEHLPLREAILEVNHWCHEKATYTPSDSRTSSPLATVKTAYGRCGEESVLLVAALRAMSIPARQVYTPRWAHTDDNHAWVEAWADGKWHFLGACEPEPVLNMAWFNEPASRGMLMHTKVFGNYNSDYEVIDRTACYTEINVTQNYAKTATMNVTVVDENDQAVSGAWVEFKLYNYAEFYTVAKRLSDEKGHASLSAGLGDMLVWASKNGHFGFGKVSCGSQNETRIKLDKRPGDEIALDIDIAPPPSSPILVQADQEQRQANAIRLQQEDSIRNAYMKTFYNRDRFHLFVLKADKEEERMMKILEASRGNWENITKFIYEAGEKQSKAITYLLEIISAKDLRDTPAEVLLSHFKESNSPQNDFEARYIFNPRVDNELLSAYRKQLKSAFDRAQTEEFQNNPEKLADWVKKNILVRNDLNPQAIPMLPCGVWQARMADGHSRDIFFVALARSLGIASRINPVDGAVQYHKGTWKTVSFGNEAEPQSPTGTATATYSASGQPVNPRYYNHFTIARIQPDGRLLTLDFSQSEGNTSTDDTWNGLLRNPLSLDAGNYLLISGTRTSKGNVLGRIQSFDITPNTDTRTALVMRHSPSELQVQGNIDAEATYISAATGESTSILSTTGRGYFIIGLVRPGYEPCTHALRDIAATAADLQEWNRSIILLFENEAYWKKFNAKEYGNLPSTISYGIDKNRRIAGMIEEALNMKGGSNLPVFIIADTFGRVVFVSQGYTINLGAQLLEAIHKL